MKFLKKHTLLKHLIAIIFWFGFTTINAQSNLKISAEAQLNFAEIALGNEDLNTTLTSGFGANFGVSYQLTEHFSLHSGLGINFYNSKIDLNNYSSFENTTDIEGDSFEFRYQTTNFSETQELTAITVPIALQYETTGEFRFYGKVGFEANFFVNQNYEASADNLSTTGFFPAINAVLDRPLFAGFGNFENPELEAQELDLENSYNALLEAGVKKILNNGNAVYVGIFARLGLNNIANSSKSTGLVSYNSQVPTAFLASSILESVNRQQNLEVAFTEAKLNVFGVAIRYEFTFKEKEKLEEIEEEIE